MANHSGDFATSSSSISHTNNDQPQEYYRLRRRFNTNVTLVVYCFLILQLVCLAGKIKTASGSEILAHSSNRRLGAPTNYTGDDDEWLRGPTCDYAQDDIDEMNAKVKDGLLRRGFSVREGRFHLVETPLFGANPGAPYFVYFFQDEIMLNPVFKMKPSSAVLFLGCTPSSARYFSWRSYAFTSERSTVFASLGDSTNNLVINTTQSGAFWSPPTGTNSSDILEQDPNGKLTAIVTTADAQTFSTLTTALDEAGAPNGIVNLDAVPSTRVDLEGDRSLTFMMVHRANVWDDPREKLAYLTNIRRVFLIDPPRQQKFNPLPSIPLRKHGSGNPETKQPGVEQGLAKLHDTILAQMESASYRLVSNASLIDKELDGFDCLQKLSYCMGDNRDTNYMEYLSKSSFKKKDIYVFACGNECCRHRQMLLHQHRALSTSRR